MLVIVLIINLILFTTLPLGENFYLISDWTLVLYSLLAVIAGYYAYKYHGMKHPFGKALFFLTAGVFSWLIAEFLWAYLEVFLGIIAPFPSIADLFWYIGYVPYGIGLYYLWKSTKTPLSMSRMCIAVLFILVALVLGGFYGIYPGLIDEGLTTFGKSIAVGYVVLDLALVIGHIIILSSFFGTDLIKPWAILLIAGLFTTLADILYAQIASLYEATSFFGILWDLQYILLAYGFFYYRQTAGIFKKHPLLKRG